jgi:hypothetical protein
MAEDNVKDSQSKLKKLNQVKQMNPVSRIEPSRSRDSVKLTDRGIDTKKSLPQSRPPGRGPTSQHIPSKQPSLPKKGNFFLHHVSNFNSPSADNSI